MDFNEQKFWALIIEESAYTVDGFASVYGFKVPTLRTWIREKKPRKPNKENHEKMVEAISKDFNTFPAPFHPSYGCATTEQINELESVGVGKRQAEILAEIQQQTKLKGKIC